MIISNPKLVRNLLPRILLLTCVLMLLSLAPTAVDSKADYHVPTVVRKAAGSCAVYVSRVEDDSEHGSGVLLSNSGLVLTNWHVVVPALSRNSRSITVDWLPWLSSLGYTTGTVVYAAPEIDLALIKLDTAPSEEGVRFGDGTNQGDRIYPVGFTSGSVENAPRSSWDRAFGDCKRIIDTGEIEGLQSGYSYEDVVARGPAKVDPERWREMLANALTALGDDHKRPILDSDPPVDGWEILVSNAWVTAGQSGGPCFGEDGRLIALNHGSDWDKGEFKGSGHIPLDLIRLFLVGVQDSGDISSAIIHRFDQDGGRAAIGLPHEDDGRPFCRRVGRGFLQQFSKDSEESGIAAADGVSEAFWVHGAIWAHYASNGGPDYVGYPTSEEYDVAGGRQQDFQHGTLRWNRQAQRVELVTSEDDSATATSTVFVVDCSGSMSSNDEYGQQKLEAAKEAARRYLRIIGFDQSSLGRGHRVGVVSFSNDAYPTQGLTQDTEMARAKLDGLSPMASTNFGSALDTAISWLENGSDNAKTRKTIVFLSDGMTNTGPVSRDEFVVGSADDFANPLRLYQRLNSAKIAVYTISFGVKPTAGQLMTDSNVDEEVLQRIAEVPGTGGAYFQASDSFELDEIYESSFHRATGKLVLDRRGVVSQGERKTVGSFDPGSGLAVSGAARSARSASVPFLVSAAYADGGPGRQLLITLGWLRGRLGLEIRDPSGRIVDERYPGSHLSTDSQPICLAIDNPRAGKWTATVLGTEVVDAATRYHLVVSARAPQLDYDAGAAALVGVIIMMCGIGASAAVLMGTKKQARRLLRSASNGRPQPIAKPVTGVSTAAAANSSLHSAVLVNQSDGRLISLNRQFLLIGRSPQCDLLLSDPDVSAKHAIVTRTPNGWSLEDVRSRNGTYVNGQRVSRCALADEDVIRLGSTKLTFRDQAPS